MEFFSSKKVSYKSNDSPVLVTERGGKIVYYKKNRRKAEIIFNINTEIKCFSTGTIKKVKKKENNKFISVENLLKKHPRNNFFPLSEKIKIVSGENKNKASIYPKIHTIKTDKKLFSKLPYFAKTFILFHEIGHYFYKEEKKADLFAVAGMMERGYNYSDAFFVQRYILRNSTGKINRLNFTLQSLNGK